MNFIANKKIFFSKPATKKKMKQSKLDGFLKNAAPTRSIKANRSAMLQEFFMGAVGPSRNDRSKKCTLPSNTSEAAPVETSFSSVENSMGCFESRVVMAITEGRSNARGEVGIAAIDVNSPELILCQLSDDMWYSGTIIKIQMLSPVEVLLPNTFFNSKLSNSKLLTILRCTFPSVDFKETPRKHFHDSEAWDRLEKISGTNMDDVKIALENKYYAMASCNALLSYVGIAYFLTFAEKSLRVSYESRYAAMTIDMETSKRLELVTPLSATTAKKTCLYSFMDHCMTRIGKRSLRARILEPFADVQMIKQCHEAIKELLDKENYQCTMRVILKKFHQVDRLMKLSLVTSLDDSIRASEAMISLTLMLKNCLTTVPMLLDLLSALESSVFLGIRAGLEDSRYQLVLEHIDRILFNVTPQQNSAQSVHLQRINAVKPDVDPVLDLSRTFYAKILEEIAEVAKELSVQYDMSFQLVHNTSKGYQLSVLENRAMRSYPEDLHLVSKRGNKVIFTTDRLNDLNARLKRTVDDILVTSNKIISEMLRAIRQEIDVVYLLTGIITELDLIQCFASLSRGTEFCCPAFGEETRIVDAIHPFLEFGRLKTLPVPNQVMATPDHNLFLITGPNMGGKTVYIKMVAVLQVMAQVGCFIPAQSAQFRICDKLFSRIGFEDSIDKGVSSFGLEVEQMSFILNHVTPNSLVIVDELGRGTNPIEGQEWAYQMCTQLAGLKGFRSNGQFYIDDSRQEGNNGTMDESRRPVKSITSPFVYVTTHFQELTTLSDKFFNVVNLFLVAEENNTNGQKQLTYTHRVQVGVTPLKEYGLALARTVKFPRKVMPKAEDILLRIKNSRVRDLMSANSSVCSDVDWSKEKLLYDLYSSIASICRRVSTDNISANVDGDLREVLREFGTKCSLDFRNSIRNFTIDETFNQSEFMRENTRTRSGYVHGTPLRSGATVECSYRDCSDDDTSEIIPETPQPMIVSSQSSNVTRATNTSWLTDVDEERNYTMDASQVAHHRVLRRLEEKGAVTFECDQFSSPFNVHKGFPVLPFVKKLQLPEERSQMSEKHKSPPNIKECINVVGSPDLFANVDGSIDEDLLDDHNNEETPQLVAGGDNMLLEQGRKDNSSISRTKPRDCSSFFFDEDTLRNNDPEALWDTIQTQLRKENVEQKSFRFDSPEQAKNTQQYFASQFEVSHVGDRFEVRNGRNIPCTVTSNAKEHLENSRAFHFDSTVDNDKNIRDEDKNIWTQTENTQTDHLEEQILDYDEYSQRPNLPNPYVETSSLMWSQQLISAEEDRHHSSTADSNYNFRLGLLINSVKGNPTAESAESVNSPYQSSVVNMRCEPNQFIAKYGKVVQENYKKTQSQISRHTGVTPSKNTSQIECKEFLERFRAKVLEKQLFKEPPLPFKDSATFRTNEPFHPMASTSPSISSIHSTEPQHPKQDYSQWLGQYCRSRVQSLGIPVNRKRCHNSTMRSSKVRADIESVNKRWESYYSAYNSRSSESSSASSQSHTTKHVSFGNGLGTDF